MCLRLTYQLKSLIFSIWLLILSISAVAQADVPEFGKVTLQELQMQKCELDPTANAMYLFHQYETQIAPMIGYDFKTTIKERVRIKIFNRDAYEYGSIKGRFLGRKRNNVLEASGYIHTLDANGQIKSIKIGKEDIFKQKSSNAVDIAFAFPGMTPGCIVEYEVSYTARSSFFLLPWVFQAEIPTRLAVCHITIPDFARLEYRAVSPRKVEESEYRKVWDFKLPEYNYSFAVREIPAFKKEPLMSAAKNNYERVDFGLREDAEVNKNSQKKDSSYDWYYANRSVLYRLDEELGPGVPGTDGIIQAAKQLKKVLDKINFLVSAIHSHMQWDNEQTSVPVDVTQAWKDGIGSSADINCMLYYLFYKTGVTAYPILYNTRENGKPDQNFISLGQFDGLDVIVLDSAKTYVLDATQKTISPLVTPLNIVNSSAFLINSAGGEWINIADDRILYRESLVVSAKMDSLGTISGNASVEYYDFAKEMRINDTSKNQTEYEHNLRAGELHDFVVKNFKRSLPTDNQLPMTETFEFTGKAEETNEFIVINPGSLAQFRKNPFIANSRNFDIDLGPTQSLTITFNLEIPKGMVIEELPKNVTLIKSDSTIFFKRIADKENNVIRTVMRIQYAESFFTKDQYPALKEFFSKMFDLLNQPIVLKKYQ